MQNVEFKAEIRNLEAARRQCGLVGAEYRGSFVQIDTYFRIADGRLKRRETPGRPVEWIFYRRPDGPVARLAQYTFLTDEQARVRFGEGTLIPWKVVRKTRELWMVGNVRVHLDQVEDLGLYVEFEAVVSARHDLAECRAMVQHLREEFAPIMGEALGGSYESLVPELSDAEREPRFP